MFVVAAAGCSGSSEGKDMNLDAPEQKTKISEEEAMKMRGETPEFRAGMAEPPVPGAKR